MAAFALSMVVLLAMVGYSSAAYCVCNSALSDSVLQKNIDYACGNGADCAQILQNGACYNPNTVKDHCNYAVNSYFQRKSQAPGSCDFSNTASVSPTAPPGATSACYAGSPSSDGNNGVVISGSKREIKAGGLRVGKRQHEGVRVVYNARVIGNGNSRKMIICGMNLVFVGAEVGPWSKTGGLGDALGGLPPAMAANGHRVMTVSPRYDQYKDAWDTEVELEVKAGERTEKVRFFHCYKRGVDRVFVDHPMFLEKVWGKTISKIYGPVAGIDYQDNQLRFSLLCQAALEAPRVLNLNSSEYFSGLYGEDVVFIANDWHTALVPCYLKSMYQSRGMYISAKVAYCIHNIAYQGRFAFSDFALLNLPDEYKSSFDFIDGYDKPVKGRKINWMKAGILESHKILTVSPYYAQELVSGPDKGVELDNILRKTCVHGIVNGMDVQEWNPMTDKYTTVKFDATTVMSAKPVIKEALQAEVGLPVDTKIPVIGFIGRLEEQKGSDILATAIPEFIGNNVPIIVLGTGKRQWKSSWMI